MRRRYRTAYFEGSLISTQFTQWLEIRSPPNPHLAAASNFWAFWVLIFDRRVLSRFPYLPLRLFSGLGAFQIRAAYVYLFLHNLVCNKCGRFRFTRKCCMRVRGVQTFRDWHLLRSWLPGWSRYFSPDILIFLRDGQAVPVHAEEIEDHAMGIYQSQPPTAGFFRI